MTRKRAGSRAGATIVAFALASGLAGCAVPDDHQEDTVPSDDPAAPIAGTFDLGDGRRMYLECAGTGYPRVFIIPGQRAGAAEWMAVADGVDGTPVFQQVSAQTRTCTYDRPGTPFENTPTSRSDPVPMPTTAQAMVDDIHALLQAAGETGPSIIVAHSLGGLPALLYCAEYPDAVVGLIMVDALTPLLRDNETPEQWEIQKVLLTGDIAETLVEYPDLERADLDTSFDQVGARLQDLREMPYVVISADHPWGPQVEEAFAAGGLPDGVPSDFGYVLDNALLGAREQAAQLIPGGVRISETDSGHIVHQEQPQLVADAILGMVDAVRAAN